MGHTLTHSPLSTPNRLIPRPRPTVRTTGVQTGRQKRWRRRWRRPQKRQSDDGRRAGRVGRSRGAGDEVCLFDADEVGGRGGGAGGDVGCFAEKGYGGEVCCLGEGRGVGGDGCGGVDGDGWGVGRGEWWWWGRGEVHGGIVFFCWRLGGGERKCA